ncbi:hypothetical protein GCM10010232_66290 [Streptomyces amakusaensis]|uniref:Uncharacterized protein n=1 Tax=Streptomyces amakusaensis TaxID=67271 RepID=A0ABW0ART6_9ACTN
MLAQNGIAGFEVVILVMLGPAFGIVLAVLIARERCTPQQWLLWYLGLFALMLGVIALFGLT